MAAYGGTIAGSQFIVMLPIQAQKTRALADTGNINPH